MVLKERIDLPTAYSLDRSRYMVDSELHCVALAFALSFNSAVEDAMGDRSRDVYKVKYLNLSVIAFPRAHVPGAAEEQLYHRFMTKEKMFRSEVRQSRWARGI